MGIPLGEQVYFDVVTHNPSTGAIANADGQVDFVVYEELTDTDIGVGGSMTLRTGGSGNYRANFAVTGANGFEIGKWYNVIVDATVNAIAGRTVAMTFRVDAAENVAGFRRSDVGYWGGSTPLSLSSGRVRVDVESYASNLDFNATQTSSIRTEIDDSLIAYDALVPADLPTNFSSMVIDTDGLVNADVREWQGTSPLTMGTGSRVRVETEAWGSGLDINAAMTSSIRTEIDDGLTAYDALVPADAPTNFSSLSISAGGVVHSNVQQWDGTTPLSLSAGRVKVDVESYASWVDFTAAQRTSIRGEASAALTDYDAVVPADLPTNFSSLVIDTDGLVNSDIREWQGTSVLTMTSGSRPRVETEAYGSSLDFNVTQTSSIRTEIDDALTSYDAIVPADLPTNFASLSISAGGVVHSNVQQWDGTTPLSLSANRVRVEVESYASWVDFGTTQKASIRTQSDDALSAINLDHLVGVASAIGSVPDGTYLGQLLDDGTAEYSRATDSLQAIRDRGDSAWITGGGGGLTQSINWIPLIPRSIDLATSANVRLGIAVTNALDDLPDAGEITPGLIDIDRKAIGGTGWTNALSGGSCLETSGLIYYDAIFSSGSGFAEGDTIRVRLRGQSLTADSNTHDITNNDVGVFFYTHIRQTEVGTDNALLAANVPTNFSSLSISGAGVVQSNVQQWGGAAPLSLSSGRVRVDVESYGSALDFNATQKTSIRAQADDALSAVNLDHLVGTASAIGSIPDGTYLGQILDDGTAVYDRTTDSLQALRDRGDAAWITGGGGSITDILNIHPLIPNSIDLVDTTTWRLGLMLINSLDDLPTTGEITPGTIDIDRKAMGGTSWSSVVSGAACSELAGMVYYDETFDSGTGYAEGDSIRITFKSQKITVSANDYEVSDTNGRIFYTYIRENVTEMKSDGTATYDRTTDSLQAIRDRGDAAWLTGGSAGAGAKAYPVQVTDQSGNPLDGCEVWVTTDQAGTNVVAGVLSTDATGTVTFMLDAADYFLWRQLSGYNFANPLSFTVS